MVTAQITSRITPAIAMIAMTPVLSCIFCEELVEPFVVPPDVLPPLLLLPDSAVEVGESSNVLPMVDAMVPMPAVAAAVDDESPPAPVAAPSVMEARAST